MGRTRPAYPREFRQEAVRLIRESGKSIGQVAKDLGVADQSLRNWVKQADLDASHRTDGLTTEEQGELRRLRHENRILREEWNPEKSGRLLRSGDRDAIAAFKFVTREKPTHPVATMCRVLGASPSGYYAWGVRPPSARARADEALLVQIRSIHERSRRTYGAPRIHAELRALGVRCGKKRVARLMRQAAVQGAYRRRAGRATIRDLQAPLAPDLVRREFAVTQPDRLWVADITYIRTWAGWLYLAAVLDAFSRRVVSWGMQEHLGTSLVLDALNMALWNRQPQGSCTTPTTAPSTQV